MKKNLKFYQSLYFVMFISINLLDIIFTSLFWYAEVNPIVIFSGLPIFIYIKVICILIGIVGLAKYSL